MDTADLTEASRFCGPVPPFRHSWCVVLVTSVPGTLPTLFRSYFRIGATPVLPFPAHPGAHPRGFPCAVFLVQKALHSGRAVSVIELEGLRIVAIGLERVSLPENGQLAINPPLTPGRLGALSTRSARPNTITLLNRAISGVGGTVKVTNPLLDRTKGEVCGLSSSWRNSDRT